MTDSLQDAMEEFADARINFLGEHEPEKIQNLYGELNALETRLRENMTAEQLKLMNDCEAIYSELDAETTHFYYKGGFSDAVRLLLKCTPLGEIPSA